MNKRYIFIGDVHGCYEEVSRLLMKVKPTKKDEVYGVGDFLDRGPAADQCINLWMEQGYKAVLGNHDKRFIDWYEGKTVDFAEGFERTIEILHKDKRCINFLMNLPYLIELPQIKVILVHGAMDVNIDTAQNIENARNKKNEDIYLRGRYINKTNIGQYQYVPLGQETTEDILWVNQWNEPDTIVYGHTPHPDTPIIRHLNTFGIDGGGVYGGYFTALIFEEGKGWYYESVKADTSYWKRAEGKKIVII